VKKPWLAFILNFLLAGAGLAYLGLWLWGVVNLLAAVALGIGLVLYVPASQQSWLEIVLPVTNGIIAQAIAQSRNAKLKSQQAKPQPTEANP
jgi:hypothetical protein